MRPFINTLLLLLLTANMLSCGRSGKKAGGSLQDDIADTISVEQLETSSSTGPVAEDMEPELTEDTEEPYIPDYSGFELITPETAAMLGPILKSWTGYYGLDINTARLTEEKGFDLLDLPDPESLDYWEFLDEDDREDVPAYVYSPNKRRYIWELGLYYVEETGEFIVGYDDSQKVYLFDRDERIVEFVEWHGSGGITEAAFWVNDDIFILTGYEMYSGITVYYMRIVDIAGRTDRLYYFFPEDGKHFEGGNYVEDVFAIEKLKEINGQK